MNTDAGVYGGSNVGNFGSVIADDVALHDLPASIGITIPPLATVVFLPG